MSCSGPSGGSQKPVPRFRLSGDRGLLVELGTSIDLNLNQVTRSLASKLLQTNVPGIVDAVPAYASVLILYAPEGTDIPALQQAVGHILDTEVLDRGKPGRVVEIPVCYAGAFGPDIETVAQTNNLTVQEVIDIHSGMEYPVYMIGFAPGFPYLGGLDKRLHTPRLDTPRSRVEAGSVGIANNQTGIYPLPSPGGWQLIGRTPLRLFAPELDNPVPYYRPGDRLRFVPISEEDFERIVMESDHA